MKTKRITAALLLSVILLSSCASDQNDGSDLTDTSAVNSATEKDSSPAEKEPDTEKWIEIGLEAYSTGDIPDFDAAAYFAEVQNVSLLSLYDDMYFYDTEAFEAVAKLVCRYIIEQHGEDALYDLSKRIEYKDAWLKSLDPSLSYANDPESEVILSSMSCDRDAMFEYIITVEDAVYAISAYDEAVSPSLAHTLIYRNTVALRELKDMITELDSDGTYFDTTARLEYILTFDASPGNIGADGRAYIGKYEDFTAVSVAAMLRHGDPDSLWIKEGLAEMLGKSYRNFYLSTYDRVYYIQPDYIDYLSSLADEGYQPAVYYLGISAYYYGAGGKSETDVNGYFTIDNALYTHAAAKSELDTEYYTKLSDVMTVKGDGAELSRCQAASFLLYLTEQTSLDTVLEVYADYSAFEKSFGGDFDTVKAQWLDWLDAKFAG